VPLVVLFHPPLWYHCGPFVEAYTSNKTSLSCCGVNDEVSNVNNGNI